MHEKFVCFFLVKKRKKVLTRARRFQNVGGCVGAHKMHKSFKG